LLDYLQDASGVVERITSAVAITVDSLVDGTVNQEPHFTDRMLARIEDAVNEAPNTRARWRARTLTDRGRNAEESVLGADFHGTFEVFSSEIRVAKGFLAQAKLLEPSATLPSRDLSRLREQCQRMLDLSPDSFVFLYSTKGVRVASAASVTSATNGVIDDLGTKTIAEFFLDHFKCFIGDPRLGHPTIVDRLMYYPPLRPLERLTPSALRITVLDR